MQQSFLYQWLPIIISVSVFIILVGGFTWYLFSQSEEVNIPQEPIGSEQNKIPEWLKPIDKNGSQGGSPSRQTPSEEQSLSEEKQTEGESSSGDSGSVTPQPAAKDETADTSTSSVQGWQTYQNTTPKFEIKYPQNWEKGENVIGLLVVFLSPKENALDFQENVNVTAGDLPQGVTMDQYVAASIEQSKKTITDLKIVESTETTFLNLPAQRLVITGKLYMTNLKTLSIIVQKDRKVYAVSYVADINNYTKFLDTANKIISTFKII